MSEELRKVPRSESREHMGEGLGSNLNNTLHCCYVTASRCALSPRSVLTYFSTDLRHFHSVRQNPKGSKNFPPECLSTQMLSPEIIQCKVYCLGLTRSHFPKTVISPGGTSSLARSATAGDWQGP